MLTLGFLGPDGTFSSEAAREYVRDNVRDLRSYDSIFGVLEDVSNGVIDEGIVPLENSTEGSISSTLDTLAKSDNLQIIYEIDLCIEHYLLGQNGLKLEEIKAVYSHIQVLGQCSQFLYKNLRNIPTLASKSSAEAVELAINSDKEAKIAAIGSKYAANKYKLAIIEEKIQDFDHNVTRFVVVSLKPIGKLINPKSSLVFSTQKDKPGSLYSALGEFANRGINLTKIESRPSKKVLGEYLFFMDFEGAADEPKHQEAIAALKANSSFFRFLGSYSRKGVNEC